MLDLTIKQGWLDESSDTGFEEFKSVLAEQLNYLPEDRHTETRWSITKVSEGDEAYLLYNESSIATLKIENKTLRFRSAHEDMPRQDDVLFIIRYVAYKLRFAVYSNLHNQARLAKAYELSLDHSYFQRDTKTREFFENSQFIPRYAPETMENLGDGTKALKIYGPYYGEHKGDGSIHILNNMMLDFLLEKGNQKPSREFSYRVADSMSDFARKHDLGLIPRDFYQNYGKSIKIINPTFFDTDTIKRKVFIDPYIWDFDDEKDQQYYTNTDTGVRLMDKVRKGETLDAALKRILREELKVADDYVGARVFGVEFDRDRDGHLVPRLGISVYVRKLKDHKASRDHDWVSLK